MKKELKNEFLKSLTNIYNMEMINFFFEFLQGEQAVLFAMKMSGLNTASAISEKLNITKSRMTTIVNNLIKKNFVESMPSPTDGRVKILELKEDGFNFIENKELESLAFLELYMKHMGDQKIIQFTKLLNETAEIMKGAKLND